EEAAIGKTVRDFRAALPDAAVYVYDNNSKDRTVEVAREAGAIVRTEPRQGKGNVMRRMFADVDADIYVLADGDDTYDAAQAPELVAKLQQEELDLVTGRRVHTKADAYRAGHVLGNKMLTGLTALMFNIRLKDMLSGYRIMSRRFVKSFPLTAGGFSIETELTVHAVRLLLPMAEVDTAYKERPVGSASKLNTYRDGFRILFRIAQLIREERPLFFFSVIAAVLAAISMILGWSLLIEFIETQKVPRLPTALLATGLMVIAFLSLMSGLILDTVTRGRWEAKRMAYLSFRGPHDRRNT
ncbi:MAG: glycosyltransferase, partial [Alphaproteobacteria bacterium]|nr:glycosyltransferase [Alphaproteobacteria bacterium]